MVSSHLTWDAKTLDDFLTSSTAKVPGTAMPVAIPDGKIRADVIAYLGTLGHAAPAAKPAEATPAAMAPVGHGPSQAELLHAAADTHNWLYNSKDYTGQRFVDLKQIDANNAGEPVGRAFGGEL